MTIHRIGAAFFVLLLATVPALADETTDALKRAKASYRHGNMSKTYAQLEAAATLIVRRLSEQYAKTLPPAPQGWRAEPVSFRTKGKHRIGRGLVLRRNYFEKGGRGVATVQVNIDQQNLIESAKSRGSNKKHAAAARRTLVPVKGAGHGFIKFDRSRGVGNIYAYVSNRIYITVTARNIKSQDFLTRLLSNWDYAGLKRTAGLN